MNENLMRTLARRGAEARLADIATERTLLLAEFPELAAGAIEAADASLPPTQPTEANDTPTRRRRQVFSPAQKRAISRRMKRYWKSRREASKANSG